jgi:Ca-activated chloride channel homolog
LGETNQSVVKGTIRQILLITDGCSNLGGDPVEIAQQARQKRIVVNVIGIVDKGDLGRAGKEEILSISDAGGGMCRVVQSSELSATAQMMTHQTMQMTLQQVVNQELMEAMGKSTDDLAPAERARVAKVVDKLEEELRLELVVAVDTSASMKDKMQMVREAIRDLSLSLEARLGETEVAVIAFPGSSGKEAEVIQPFTAQLDVTRLEGKLTARGGTPTAPALKEAIRLFAEIRSANRTDQDESAGEGVPSSWPDDDLPAHRWDGSSPAS